MGLSFASKGTIKGGRIQRLCARSTSPEIQRQGRAPEGGLTIYLDGRATSMEGEGSGQERAYGAPHEARALSVGEGKEVTQETLLHKGIVRGAKGCVMKGKTRAVGAFIRCRKRLWRENVYVRTREGTRSTDTSDAVREVGAGGAGEELGRGGGKKESTVGRIDDPQWVVDATYRRFF